ncbi:TlpA disulfide reductase family protein [Amycolatopsis sp. CA-230715]|uniref:TlpA disulfide reductase family protein n=1 Tax=Amycolatopsis sp. CA-230715 TaxID=2745196 RepID=UPI001C00B6FD|nr:TlpA disulfide reductase family protein [Amycolatopsis sp. CA-230715]QWF81373.1 Thiol-disulfide oxidoreductase ResA [Amycolatopsis sp. CA-230715]
MTTATKWALGVGVLVLALIVALLPRGDRSPAPGAGPDLAAARAKAALAACPSGDGEVERFRGVAAQCLGDGAQVDLGRALAGHKTLVNVWATWCPPCKEELPVLGAYAAEPGAARVLIVQVASSAADGLDLLAKLGVKLPTVFDGEGQQNGPVRAALKTPPTLPASYVVEADGTVRFVETPRTFTSTAQVREAVGAA